MRRLAVLVLTVSFMVFGVVGNGTLETADAQEATPCPLWPPQASDITTWEVGQFSQWPSTTLVQFEPGAKDPGYDGTDKEPVISLIYIQTGVFTLRSDVPMAIHRGDADGAPEMIDAGTDFEVEAGDYFINGPIDPEIRNDGRVAASYQSATLYPASPTITDPCAPLGEMRSAQVTKLLSR